MAKIILNGCFGGYGWSKQAKQDYCALTGRTFEEDEYFDIGRKDPIGILLLEEKGSEYCSGRYAKLYIEEYNDEDYIPRIMEYDGSETLELIPRLTEERVRTCENIDEIVKLLQRLGVFREEREEYVY